jgi:hypothetical protein
MGDLSDEREILQLVNRFTNSFDLKAWKDMKECLADTLYVDYSALRGSSPETMGKERFVDLRRAALESLLTHHLAANHDISVEGVRGCARVSMVIFRKNRDGEVLNTHCFYVFEVNKEKGPWRINAITQQVFWNDGNPSIHEGILKVRS